MMKYFISSTFSGRPAEITPGVQIEAHLPFARYLTDVCHAYEVCVPTLINISSQQPGMLTFTFRN